MDVQCPARGHQHDCLAPFPVGFAYMVTEQDRAVLMRVATDQREFFPRTRIVSPYPILLSNKNRSGLIGILENANTERKACGPFGSAVVQELTKRDRRFAVTGHKAMSLRYFISLSVHSRLVATGRSPTLQGCAASRFIQDKTGPRNLRDNSIERQEIVNRLRSDRGSSCVN